MRPGAAGCAPLLTSRFFPEFLVITLDCLTEEQQLIVDHQNGHALVSAVAGSGKTTTMVARVRHLLEQGCKPSELMVLMYNRSARDSFVHKLGSNLEHSELSAPEVRTYHALGLRLVESFARKGAIPAARLVTNEGIREKLAKQVLSSVYKEESGERAWVSKEDQEEFLRFIELVKATTLSASDCFERTDLKERYSYFIEAFERFETIRKEQRIRFFEDLLHEPLQAMLADDTLARWVGNRVEHIIVDEYQDINEVQQQLLKILAGNRAQVMAVGDVDQCIYEWRGARPDYITSRFQHDFPDPSRYTLSYTFRYGHRLSLAANYLISRNRQRDRKLCVSASDNFDTRLERYVERDRHPIIEILADWLQQGRSLADAAVLVRLYGMSVPLELALLEANIPYRLDGHEEVFECREIMALTGYLKLCTGELRQEENHVRSRYLLAMLSQPHLGIQQEQLERLAEKIATDVSRAPECILGCLQGDIPAWIRKKISQIGEDWRWLLQRPADVLANRLLEDIISRFDLYEFYIKFSTRLATAENRIETCRAFVEFADRQKLSAPDFLAKLHSLQKSPAQKADGSLLITSVHRAKGLEWPLVILPGLKDGFFPFSAETDEMITTSFEDERRLFYVAMTRAIERLVFIHPPDQILKKRLVMGLASAPSGNHTASRFLFETNLLLSDQVGGLIGGDPPLSEEKLSPVDVVVANQYLNRVDTDVSPLAKRQPKQKKVKKNHPLRTSDLARGLNVTHRSFGEGKIIEVLDRSQGRIRINFTEHGEKTLLLSFAPLSITL